MRELLVESCQEEDEEGAGHRFDYFVVVDKMEVSGGFACESYGVRIAGPDGGESICVPNITTSASRIDELMELLTRNFVTPTTLRDVIDDWL